VLVNAAGPFAKNVSDLVGSKTKAGLVFSKGIHLVLNRKLTSDYQVLAFWDEEGRLFYVLPMGDRSMVGTTDTRVDDPHTEVSVEDREFVLRQINAQMELEVPIDASQIVAERCGVRPLVVEAGGDGEVADWHQLSRKHIIEADLEKKVVTVLGGKLTDCLNVGEEIIAEVKRLGLKPKAPGLWYGEGSQIRKQEFFGVVGSLAPKDQAERIADGIWRRHGEKGFELCSDGMQELIPGLGITEAEIRHVVKSELVKTREDLLRRRLPISMARSDKELLENQKLEKLFVELGLN
jgi:glycerol-3-phosphate dehydrogenase